MTEIAVAPAPEPAIGNGPLVVAKNVVQEFRVAKRGSLRMATVSAVANVSFTIGEGKTLAVVGETGSGKTTLARTLLGAPPLKSGELFVRGVNVGHGRAAAKNRARLIQMIFQDPASALDPRWSVERTVTEPLRPLKLGKAKNRQRVIDALKRVGLDYELHGRRRPGELSGGQQQRVAIARALVSRPALVIADEPVTALDAATQSQVIELLAELKREFGLTYLLIAHDLAVVKLLADNVATMYLGKFCEEAPTRVLFNTPAHPYTAALLSAIPSFTPNERPRIRLLGEPPSPIDPPSGCRFRTRCAFAQDICAQVEPVKRAIAPEHYVACHFPLDDQGRPSTSVPDPESLGITA